jgi:hypothetical protein
MSNRNNLIFLNYAAIGLCILFQIVITIGYNEGEYGYIPFVLLESFVTAIQVILLADLIKIR